jgi:tRNA-Thr(GGU) m(6)t(6)A37 methyltransferase TsaA
MEITPIARFRSPFTSKFGIPKQSGLVRDLPGRIVFELAYRNTDSLRGMDGFSHLWLIWQFSANAHKANSPVVRPPLLGGNQALGVFATRSPYRPNPLGLSCVRIDHIDLDTPDGPVIHVLGADLMDGTPIFDIKPYLPYADCHPDATGGFTTTHNWPRLEVRMSDKVKHALTEDEAATLADILALDPRPHYQKDPTRIYGMPYGRWDVRFRVTDGVVEVIELSTVRQTISGMIKK